MQSRRKRRLRLFAGVSVVSLLAGLLGMVGLAAIPGTAFADTPGFTVSCTGVPVVGTLTLSGTVITGSINPDPVPASGSFAVSNFGLDLSVPASLASLAAGKTIAVTVNGGVDVSGGAPTTASATFTGSETIPSSVPSSGLALTLPGTLSPSSFTAASTGTVTVSSTTSPTTSITLAGTAIGTFDCTEPAETIASAPIKVLPTAVASPSSASPPATVDVSGINWPSSTKGTLAWTSGTDTGTFTVSSSGDMTGTIPLTSKEQGTATTPFSDPIIATDSTVTSDTASAPFTVVPVVALPTFCETGGSTAKTETGSCTTKQQVSTTVGGTVLSISESAADVTLSGITLGNPTATTTAVPAAVQFKSTYDYSCIAPVLGAISLPVTVTGSVDPVVSSGQKFDLQGVQTSTTIPASLVNTALFFGLKTLSGTVTTFNLHVSGASPALYNAAGTGLAFGPVTLTANTPVTLTLPATAADLGPFQATGGLVTFTPGSLDLTAIVGIVCTPPLQPQPLATTSPLNDEQFLQATGHLNPITVMDDRGTLSGWTVTGQLESNFVDTNPPATAPAQDTVIPADFLTWYPSVALATPGELPNANANAAGCPTQSSPSNTYPTDCTGPSGLPSSTGKAGGAGVNGTGGGTGKGGGTGGVTDLPSEAIAGPAAALQNLHGSADVLCTTKGGSNGPDGGGGGFVCSAGLSLAVPPYVAQGTYQATIDIVVTGL
ncbi:MAG: DUF6801 domain-containing protein [Acidimicrobiales bacterium]